LGANKLRFNFRAHFGFKPPFWGTNSVGGNIMKNIVSKVQRFLKSEDGPTAVEYAIMLALIVIVCLAAIQSVGTNATSKFNEIAAQLA